LISNNTGREMRDLQHPARPGNAKWIGSNGGVSHCVCWTFGL